MTGRVVVLQSGRSRSTATGRDESVAGNCVRQRRQPDISGRWVVRTGSLEADVRG
jgi:hypothetical protein